MSEYKGNTGLKTRISKLSDDKLVSEYNRNHRFRNTLVCTLNGDIDAEHKTFAKKLLVDVNLKLSCYRREFTYRMINPPSLAQPSLAPPPSNHLSAAE